MKLSVEQILRLKTALTSRYGEMHRRMRKCLDLYNGEYHIISAKARQAGKIHEVLPATARIVVDSITAHVKPSQFKVRFPPVKNTEAAREQADLLEEAAHEILHRNAALKACSPFGEATKNAAIYGMAPVRTLYDPRGWGERPARRAGEGQDEFEYRVALWEAERRTRLPFHIAAVDPLNCLPGPGVESPRFMIETYQLTPFELMEDFPDLIDPELFAQRTFTAFWSPEQWMYFLGGEPLSPTMALDPQDKLQQINAYMNAKYKEPTMLRMTDYNPYGFVPYELIWSGLGKNSPEGKPEQRAVGLIWPLISLLKEEARALTSISIILQATALPRFLTRNAPLGGMKVELAPGGVTELGNTMIEPFPEMKVSPDVYKIMQLLSQQIELMLGAKLLSGARPTGVTSALFEEILMEEAKKRYLSFINSIESAYARVLAQELFIWEHIIGEPIPGIRLKPEKIKGHYHCEIEFRYEDIAEQRIKAMIARMLHQAGLFSFVQAHEYMGTENITEARKEMIKDSLYRDPYLIASLGMKMLEEMGLTEVYQRAMARLQGQQAITSAAQIQPSKEEQPILQQLLAGANNLALPEPSKGGGFGFGEGAGMEGGEEAELGVEI